MNNLERLEQLDKYPDKSKDWSRISEDYEQDSVSIEPGQNLTLYAHIPEELLFNGKISVGAKVLFAVYHCYMLKGKSFVGRDKLATHFKGQKGRETVNVKTISRWTVELEQNGWIKVKRGLKTVKVNGQGKLIETNIIELQGKKIRCREKK